MFRRQDTRRETVVDCLPLVVVLSGGGFGWISWSFVVWITWKSHCRINFREIIKRMERHPDISGVVPILETRNTYFFAFVRFNFDGKPIMLLSINVGIKIRLVGNCKLSVKSVVPKFSKHSAVRIGQLIFKEVFSAFFK